MSIHPEDHYAIRVLKAGALGYLSKDLAPEELINAVKKVLSGKRYITEQVADKLAAMIDFDESRALHELLSDREFTVLKMLAGGKSISAIAEIMFLSVNTISTYRARILLKMNLKNNTDLTLYSIEHNLI
jgi:DNA-binding NarL/FixJ family response regulator